MVPAAISYCCHSGFTCTYKNFSGTYIFNRQYYQPCNNFEYSEPSIIISFLRQKSYWAIRIEKKKLSLYQLKITTLIWLIFTVHIGCAQQPGTPLPFGLQIMGNNEQVSFCVPIPVKEYSETSGGQRAKKVFINKKDKKYQLLLQGLFRTDTSISMEKYAANTFTAAEAAGKVIEQKGLINNNNCFYFCGYTGNKYSGSRFIEITWLRKDDLVKLQVTFPVADTAIWNKRLQTICTFTSICE